MTDAANSATSIEAFLSRLYTDATARARFLEDPYGESARAGLDASTCEALEAIDRVGLTMAADSYQHKRGQKVRRQKAPQGFFRRLTARFRSTDNAPMLSKDE